MRRSLLAIALLLGVLAGFVPGDATADPKFCNRILMFTGTKSPGTNPADGTAIPARLNVGSAGCTLPAKQDTNRIIPGSNVVSVRATQAPKEATPVSGTLTNGDQVVELELKANAPNPANASQFNSQEIPIDYAKVTKLVATITFADGSEQSVTYSK